VPLRDRERRRRRTRARGDARALDPAVVGALAVPASTARMGSRLQILVASTILGWLAASRVRPLPAHTR
jgi:hypothetical protein